MEYSENDYLDKAVVSLSEQITELVAMLTEVVCAYESELSVDEETAELLKEARRLLSFYDEPEV